MNDKYSCFEELAGSEIEGEHYEISFQDLCASSCVIVAPHGGTIEPGSAEIARAVAADKFSWYLFESKSNLICPNSGKQKHDSYENTRFFLMSKNFYVNAFFVKKYLKTFFA